MPVTVNANATNSPPQFEVTLSTPDGSAMTAVTLYRTAGGVRTTTRVQPQTGLASRYVEDPEGPWDTPVTYSATMTYAGGTTTDTAAAATLTPSPAAVWAVHPLVPSRSMAIDVADFGSIGVASVGAQTRSAQATQHAILGSDVPLLTRLGSRKAVAGVLDVTTVSLTERARLLALVNDEIPLMIRVPAAWGWGWEDGYYAIGDVGEERRLQYGADASRTIHLPFQKVAAPAGVQQSQWGWGDLVAGYADWNAVTAHFADWNALAGNNPT